MNDRDGGFTLVEVLVSIMVIGVIMTALAAFFTNSVSITNQQRTRQAAVQLASDATERVRALKGAGITAGRDKQSSDVQWSSPVAGVSAYLTGMLEAYDASAAFPAGATATLPTSPETTTVNGLGYGRNWYIGTCWQAPAGGDCTAVKTGGYIAFYRVVVAVTWAERHCPASACSYVTSTLVSGVSIEPVFNANATAQPPAVNNPGTQVGEVSVAAPLQLGATGGAPPLTWAASGLPTGLTMNSAGLVSGAPTAAGTYSVTVTATDGFSLVGSAVFTWTVNALPQLTTPPAQVSTVSRPVALALTRTGGTAAYTWSATGLPTGVAIDAATGAVTGTPTTPRAAGNVTVTVADSFGKTATATFTWQVNALPTVVSPAGTRTDPTGTAINLQATASGGTGAYSWTATGLPTGLSMSGTGLITGTPTVGTRFLTTFTVTDSLGAAQSSTLVWNITTTGVRVTAPATDRTDAVNSTVNVGLSAAGGATSSYTWTATGLPTGVTLNGTTLNGKPTKTGVYTVTLVAKDSANKTATFVFTWTIQ